MIAVKKGGKYMKPPSIHLRTCLHETLPHKLKSMATMVTPKVQPNYSHITEPHILISVLRNSTSISSIPKAQMVHSCMIKNGFYSNLILLNNLLHFFYSCGLNNDAVNLFNEMPVRDVVSWNTMISGCAKSGCYNDGVVFFREMRRSGVSPSQSSFVSVLIGGTESCRGIHGECLKCGLCCDLFVGNSLLTAYVKLGDVKEARKVFDGMWEFDEVSVEILLRGYLQEGSLINEALELFRYSLAKRVPFSAYAVSSILSLCASIDGSYFGTQIHSCVVKDGLSTDVSVVNSLITMYARMYLLEDAMCLFDDATSRDVCVSAWVDRLSSQTTKSSAGCFVNHSSKTHSSKTQNQIQISKSFLQNSKSDPKSVICWHSLNKWQGDAGLGFVGRFMFSGMLMNEASFSSLLSCCGSVTCLQRAKEAHGLIIKLRKSRDVGSDNIILNMYCSCGSLSDATSVFKIIEERGVVSYNLMIGLFRSQGLHEDSVSLLHQIQLEGLKVDEFIYSNIISSCSRLADLELGKLTHGCIIKTGFDLIVPLGNSLLEMYSRCGELQDMEKLVNEIGILDVFAWNTLFMGYTSRGLFDESIQIWEKMKESGVGFNEFSYCAMVDVCSNVKAPLMGAQIHANIKKLGLGSDTTLMNSIITLYSSCGMMEKASAVFEEISFRDSVSWNAMVCGYAQNDLTEESLGFYLLMNLSGYKPNNVTFVSILKSCADHSKLVLGLKFHAEVLKTGFEADVTLSNSLITMYAKCGEISAASKIFKVTVSKDVITWNSMICAFAHHGRAKQALDTISEMELLGEKPNAVTFIGALSACSHAGLTTEARVLFNSMFHEHGIVPSEEHYACMVDIFCRAGRLSEAKEFIENMSCDSSSLIWRTFLSGCNRNENIELGEVAAEKLLQLEPHDSSAYVLLSNIYASAEKMEKKFQTRRKMGSLSVKKDTGYSWVCS